MPEHVHNDAEAKLNMTPAVEEKNAIGEQLRKQRKARGISLVEVAEHTKIGKKYLEALENEEYGLLPGETYTIGFMRAYAKYLELDEVDVLKRYKEQKRMASSKADNGGDGAGVKNESNQSLWLPLLAILVLAGLGAGLFLLWPSPNEKIEAKPEATDVAGFEMQSAVVVPDGLQTVSDLTLKIRAKEKTWVTVMVDGRQEPDVTLNANEERTWTAKDRFVMWTGNAGGIEVTFNGELQQALGQRGEVRKEVIFERQPAAVSAPVQTRP